jgi:transposase
MKVKTRRQFTAEFRQNAVEESIRSPETVKAVAGRLGISPRLLESWRGKMTKGREPPVKNAGPDKSLKELEAENKRLKKRLDRVELENEILKKAREYFDKLPK